MHVSFRDMAPGVRVMGSLVRMLMPRFTVPLFERQNRLLDKWLKGHWMGWHTCMEEVEIPRADGTKLRLCVVQPRHAAAELRTGLLWMHGGGYAIGLPEQDVLFADLFARDGGCTLVMPDYRRSMQAPYPAALEDCYVALRWMASQAQVLGVREDQLFVGGDSAGGGLAAALCLYARDRGEVNIAYQLPLYPMLDDRMETPSAQENDAPVWNTASNRAAWGVYLRGMAGERVPPYAAPARAEDVSGLPPACTFVGTLEPFHDETLCWFRRLAKAGVPVQIRTFPGCYHAFDLLSYPSRPAREARAFVREAFRDAQARYVRPQPEKM